MTVIFLKLWHPHPPNLPHRVRCNNGSQGTTKKGMPNEKPQQRNETLHLWRLDRTTLPKSQQNRGVGPKQCTNFRKGNPSKSPAACFFKFKCKKWQSLRKKKSDNFLVGGWVSTHLKNITQSNWIISSGFGVRIPKIFELPPTSNVDPSQNWQFNDPCKIPPKPEAIKKRPRPLVGLCWMEWKCSMP